MTTTSSADLRSRLHEAHATQHVGFGGDEAAALVYRRDIRPLLPPPAAGLVVDIGSGSGALVRPLRADGYHAECVDISPEQAVLASAARVMIWQVVSACYRIGLAAKTGIRRGHIVTQNLTFAVRKGLFPTES